jgi:hypothetical protein
MASSYRSVLASCWSMILSENRYPLFGIMLWCFMGAARGDFDRHGPGHVGIA